jgi:hypothetical protein
MRASRGMVVGRIRKNIFCFENFVARLQATACAEKRNKAIAH